MKVSVDYLFFNCRMCPFVSDKGDMFDIKTNRYVCKILKLFVNGEGIPEDCPLKKDEEGKIYNIICKDVQ